MAEPQPATQPAKADTPKNPARFLAHVLAPYTQAEFPTDEGPVLLTADPVEVSFDQAAQIQEAAGDMPVVITEKVTTEKKTEK